MLLSCCATSYLLLAALGPLIVPDGVLGLCAGRQATAGRIRSQLLSLRLLRAAVDVVVVPHLAEDGAPVILGALAGLGLVVPGAGAPEEGDEAELLGEGLLDLGEGVGRLVGGLDVGLGEPLEGGEGALELDDGLEELEEVAVLRRLWALNSKTLISDCDGIRHGAEGQQRT